MNKKKIKEEYNKKIKLIREYNKLYFDQNDPAISDSKDSLKKKYITFRG